MLSFVSSLKSTQWLAKLRTIFIFPPFRSQCPSLFWPSRWCCMRLKGQIFVPSKSSLWLTNEMPHVIHFRRESENDDRPERLYYAWQDVQCPRLMCWHYSDGAGFWNCRRLRYAPGTTPLLTSFLITYKITLNFEKYFSNFSVTFPLCSLLEIVTHALSRCSRWSVKQLIFDEEEYRIEYHLPTIDDPDFLCNTISFSTWK